MMARFDLTDFEWSAIEPLHPTKVHGKAHVDARRVLNRIFWRLRTGAPWADIPARSGLYDCKSLQQMAPFRAPGTHSQRDIRCLRRRYTVDRLLVNPHPEEVRPQKIDSVNRLQVERVAP
ncbi:transposase [Ochrobactrum soli]|nr:transposase [[Ochrobactrum] soli]